MDYQKVVEGIFIERPNRFIARIMLPEGETIAHVKNTGRCWELLIPGVRVCLEDHGENTTRKTRYSLISVWKGDMLINMDSQVPNAVAADALEKGLITQLPKVDLIKREKTFGDSRFDIYYERGEQKGFLEVKGVTLEEDGIARFPDAPTIRGTKHIMELIKAKKEGYKASILFLVQMKGPVLFEPNKKMDPEFAEAVQLAAKKGVQILVYDSVVTPNSITIGKPINNYAVR